MVDFLVQADTLAAVMPAADIPGQVTQVVVFQRLAALPYQVVLQRMVDFLAEVTRAAEDLLAEVTLVVGTQAAADSPAVVVVLPEAAVSQWVQVILVAVAVTQVVAMLVADFQAAEAAALRAEADSQWVQVIQVVVVVTPVADTLAAEDLPAVEGSLEAEV